MQQMPLSKVSSSKKMKNLPALIFRYPESGGGGRGAKTERIDDFQTLVKAENLIQYLNQAEKERKKSIITRIVQHILTFKILQMFKKIFLNSFNIPLFGLSFRFLSLFLLLSSYPSLTLSVSLQYYQLGLCRSITSEGYHVRAM